MPRGYDRPLYILPIHEHLGDRPSADPMPARQLLYDGLQMALAAGALPERAGIVVDQAPDPALFRDAAAQGIATALTLQGDGDDEFDLERIALSLPIFDPTFYKATVRFNPVGDRRLNATRAMELSLLSAFLATQGRGLFMLELLVPPLPAQMQEFEGDEAAYDVDLRPHLMIEAIRELQDAGVDPDVWVVDGLDRREDYESLVAVSRAGGRDQVGCVIRGGNETHHRLRCWLETASGVAGIIGYALGRIDISDPIAAWQMKKATREQAVAVIAARYLELADLCDRVCLPRPRYAAAHRMTLRGPSRRTDTAANSVPTRHE